MRPISIASRSGMSATFIAEADTRIELPLRLTEIARASTRVLPDPALASTLGGPIAVRAQKQNEKVTELVPDRTIYRLRLAVADGHAVPVTRVLRGEVILRGEAISLVRRSLALRSGGRNSRKRRLRAGLWRREIPVRSGTVA